MDRNVFYISTEYCHNKQTQKGTGVLSSWCRCLTLHQICQLHLQTAEAVRSHDPCIPEVCACLRC